MLTTRYFLKAGRQLEKLYTRSITQVSDAYDLTKVEVDVLLFLYNNPEYDTARDIVELRGIAKSYVSKAVDLLINKGFLQTETDAKDRRVSHLTIQALALPIVKEARLAQDKLIQTLYQGISEEEQERLETIFTKMAQNVQEAL